MTDTNNFLNGWCKLLPKLANKNTTKISSIKKTYYRACISITKFTCYFSIQFTIAISY